MIREITFKPENYTYEIQQGATLNEIARLSKVNIFVGANNTGKSRFLRNLLMENFNSEVNSARSTGNSTAFNDVFRALVDSKPKYEKENSSIFDAINQINQVLSETGYDKRNQMLYQLLRTVDEITDNENRQKVYLEIRQILQSKLNFEYCAYIKFMHSKAIYIPMLRGLRPLMKLDSQNLEGRATPYSDSNCFEDRVMFDHFLTLDEKQSLVNIQQQALEPKTSKSYFDGKYTFNIFTGLSLYEEIKKMLLGTHKERKFIEDYEKFLNTNFFKEKITLIPRINDDVLYINIGDKEEYPIYDLGDGLQTIIICTFPAFQHQDKSLLLFIEEPELTLHPGMQRKLFDSYRDFENFQVFITTHSNHLLDLTLDYSDLCSIYSFEKKSDKEFIIKNATPNKDVLDLLGVRSSSVFLSNCVIWVEGITDRLYVRKFLELYQNEHESNEFEEDKHYSIVEYGGDNIIHFNFDDEDPDELTINVESITKNNFIVADNDNTRDTEGKKAKRLEILNEKLAGNFFSEHIEIENLIPFCVYKKYFENIPESAARHWEYKDSKGNEADFVSDLTSMKIGEALKKHFIGLKEGFSATDSYNRKDISCIGDKTKLALKLINIIEQEKMSFNDLPEIAQDLTKRIYKFINEKNAD